MYDFSQEMQAHLDWQGSAQLFRPHTAHPEIVSLRIASSGLIISGNQLQLELPVGSFHISEQPNTAFVKITADALGGSVVMLSDPSGIAALERYGFFVPSRSFKTPSYAGVLIFFGVLIVVGILFFTLGLQALVSWGAARIPPQLERALGESALAQALYTERVCKDSATQAVLQKCANLISSWRQDTSLHLQITIVENRTIKNAFALPGGYIVVYRGILDSIQTESELFGLLAHEAGHVVLRHGSKRLLRNVLFAALLSILLGDTQSLSGILLSQSSNLLELSYSRQEELEADQFALETLQIAGLDTHALPQLLRRLGSSSFEIPQMLSTHPSHAEREMLVQKVALPSSIKTYLSEQEWKSLFQTTSKNSSSAP